MALAQAAARVGNRLGDRIATRVSRIGGGLPSAPSTGTISNTLADLTLMLIGGTVVYLMLRIVGPGLRSDWSFPGIVIKVALVVLVLMTLSTPYKMLFGAR